MAVNKNYYETLYARPVVSLTGYCKRQRLDGVILAYLAYGGATNSIKDSLAEGILALATEKGLLRPEQTVVEASSGSFAVALAIACNHSNHPLVLCMPASVSIERQQMFARLGATVTLVSYLSSRLGIADRARQIAADMNGYFVNYFDNDLNAEFHRRITGPAIVRAAGDNLDAIVVGVGSGGTITGVGEYAKAWIPNVRIIAVEPYESQAIGGGAIGKHHIPGLGAGFVPENYNPYIVDAVMAVPSAKAQSTALDVLLSDAIPASPSGGAALCAATQLMREQPNVKRVACVFAGKQLYE
ncbi:MAG: PLP-dependent cysteine synthase family protein [Ruthenibacterium sp.]